VLLGHGFSESVVVDLDLHLPEEHSFDNYGYESDSDLESDGEEETAVESYTSGREKKPTEEASDVSRARCDQGARMGRVIVLKDTAFKMYLFQRRIFVKIDDTNTDSWKALLYYLYTRRVNFRPLKSEGPKDMVVKGPTCSPKSMYRLTDKVSPIWFRN
jgi:hypothetical protein